MKFYKVGGFVRDQIMGIKSHDLDYAVEAESYDEMRDYISSHGKIYLETPEFYTIRGKMPGMGDCDFVLCRKESDYTDGRHPDKVEVGTILDDLARRDFTMNAIAIDEDGNYIDPFEGIAHIKNKAIICVGDTETQLKQDALRMIRAVRLSVTKRMNIGYEIDHFLRNGYNSLLLDNISNDRIKDEINKMWEFDPFNAFIAMRRYSTMFEYIFQTKDIWMKATLEKR